MLEVGSLDVNGSVRPYVLNLEPASYLGTDMRPGLGVDQIVRAEDLIKEFGPRNFHVVICTEMLEHAESWRTCLANMLEVLKPRGLLVLTTRGPGFPLHGFPEDHWRFTVEDFKRILAAAGMETLSVRHDYQQPGVFVKARRPARWTSLPLMQLDFEPMAVGA